VLADSDGEPATKLLAGVRSDLASHLEPLVGGGRLLAFDRRGTGTSGPIACRALAQTVAVDAASAAACAAELGPARAFYTTRDSVEDVEAVRVAVGAERLTVYGHRPACPGGRRGR
jgi:pimeloyl-ACP methyl ester carboxylesterase